MADTKRGRVDSTNERGVKVDGEWLNYSKYAQDGAIEDGVRRGQQVEFKLDGKGFIRALVIVGSAAAQEHGHRENGNGSSSNSNGTSYQQRDPNAMTMTDVLISRQVALKAVVELTVQDQRTNGEPVMPSAMLELATEFETWLLRERDDPGAQRSIAASELVSQQAEAGHESTGAGSNGSSAVGDAPIVNVPPLSKHTPDEWWALLGKGIAAMRDAGLSFGEQFSRQQLSASGMRDLVIEAGSRINAAKQFDALVHELGDDASKYITPEELKPAMRTAKEIRELTKEIRERAYKKTAV